MSSSHVFFDSTGSRSKWFRRTLLTLATFFTVTGTLFVLSLLVVPFLAPTGESTTTRLRHLLPSIPRRADQVMWNRQRMSLLSEINREEKKSLALAKPRVANNKNAPIVAAFYAPWQDTGLASLRAQAKNLTHIMPEWLHLDANGSGLDLQDFDLSLNPKNQEVIDIARQNGIAIQPLFSNAQGDDFDAERASKLLHSPATQQLVAQKLVVWLKSNGFQGLNLDFENLNAPDYKLLPQFVAVLSQALHQQNLTLSMDLEAELSDDALRAVTAPCDFAVIMAYDEHASTDQPGPIASWKWSTQLVRKVASVVPANKLVLGIGNYAYDWTVDSKAPADSLTYQSAVLAAQESDNDNKPKEIIDFDPEALNATFEYEEDGKAHQVWMLDAVSAYNQWHSVQSLGLRGGALWVLGSEDPALWSFFRRQPQPHFQAKELENISFPYEVESDGQGEVLNVSSTPKSGHRVLEFDPESGLCTDEAYRAFPTSYIIHHTGSAKKTLALTFDDGPDPSWTPQVLDILKKNDVHATFFMLGENIERNRSLVRRVWEEGHDIGSHSFTHPNLGEVSPRRVDLELNATQRAIQSVTGHSTHLFRPPYNADSEPQTSEEVRPVLRATQLGYLTIGESIDPQDWNPVKIDDSGNESPRTTADIVNDIEVGAESGEGNVILLHDAGGNREKTLEALDQVIPALKRRGYRFVTTSELLGKPRVALMPPITGKQIVVASFDRVVFNTIFGIEWLLTVGFLGAIVLGVGRIAVVVPLAARSRRRERKVTFDAGFQPFVSVLIAAYNEEKVIERTVRSVLASDYPHFEILVVDDGSKDNTAAVVRQAFADEPRVSVYQQINGGKASALNHALSLASGEIYVGFDADTQVASDAITLLVRHFGDEKVGAVAGNVKVGNEINILTRWQAIEYITSQNLDRRAQSGIDAITVVPGAIGAWRRSAVLSLGGYLTDTLAEDMDLTWRLHRAGWVVANETAACAYTETPDTLRALFKQRFRWAYGTLQCLYKHRGALGKHGFFGSVALPGIWIFQFLLQWLAPCVDFQLLLATGTTVFSYWFEGTAHGNWQPDANALFFLEKTGFFYALFFAIELAGAYVAIRFDKEKTSHLWWLFWQRFVYRQMLYLVIWKATWTALSGFRQGWGKLSRKGTVSLPKLRSNVT